MLTDHNGRTDVAAATAGAEPDTRGGAVSVWAAVGLVWIVVSLQAIGRWMLSPDQFAPAPILGPDQYPASSEAALRILEALSMGVLAAFIWLCVVRPWRRNGRLSLEGKFVIGGVLASVADAWLNLYTYLFAWNAHSVSNA